ncbi:hypothetical protein ACFX15_003584 [Malus domestica]
MGLRRSTRLNVIIAAPSLRGSTMATTTVTTTHGEVHGTATTAQAVPSKLARAQTQVVPSKAHGTKATTQASHSHASRTEPPVPVSKLAPTTQPAPVASQAAQVGPRLSQPFGLIIESGAFSQHFSADLTFPNSNLTPRFYHHSTTQGGLFHPSSSNPNGEQHLSQQVIELTSALVQQTTLVNQLL